MVTFTPFDCLGPGDYFFKLIVQASAQTTSFTRRLKTEALPTVPGAAATVV
jgi:hypothetical protein